MTTLTTQTFKLPDVGEGLTEAEIVVWHVAVGDAVSVNQIIVDIETAKSIVELPSPYAGEVVDLIVQVGDTVPVGQPIIAIATGGPTRADTASPRDPTAAPATPRAVEGEPKLLVGYGVREAGAPRRRRGGAAPARSDGQPKPGGAAGPPFAEVGLGEEGARSLRARAKPPVRKLAQVLGVDLLTVIPTGPDGTIVRADVLGASEAGSGNNSNGAAREPADAEGDVGADAARRRALVGDVMEQRIPIKGIRKHTAAAMTSSAFTAPHVTEFLTIDFTKTLELRDVVQSRREFRDIKLTPLAFVAKAYLRAIAATPMAKGRWDDRAQEIVVPIGVNLGIAVATPRGLTVPNVKNADLLDLKGLAEAITGLASTAREGRTAPEDMTGGTTTITNVGIFGVDTGTPILNPGETAILAVGAIRRQPWVVQDERGERVEPRSILQLALSFDHRVIDGQEGSELLATTAALLVEPGLAAL